MSNDIDFNTSEMNAKYDKSFPRAVRKALCCLQMTKWGDSMEETFETFRVSKEECKEKYNNHREIWYILPETMEVCGYKAEVMLGFNIGPTKVKYGLIGARIVFQDKLTAKSIKEKVEKQYDLSDPEITYKEDVPTSFAWNGGRELTEEKTKILVVSGLHYDAGVPNYERAVTVELTSFGERVRLELDGTGAAYIQNYGIMFEPKND